MAKPKILVMPGETYGRLTVISEAEKRGNFRRFECLCECGRTSTVTIYKLASGHTQSCGCLASDITANRSWKHGMVGLPEYGIWGNIIQRCGDPDNESYPLYGGRGIRVWPEWRDDFRAFFSHVGSRPGVGYSLDRIDNDGGYEPGNVRWATAANQNRNKRTNIWVTFQGEKRLLIDVAKELGLRPGLIRRRIRRGWPESRLFETTERPVAAKCVNGHVMDTANTYMHSGFRNCRTCRLLSSRLRRNRVSPPSPGVPSKCLVR